MEEGLFTPTHPCTYVMIARMYVQQPSNDSSIFPHVFPDTPFTPTIPDTIPHTFPDTALRFPPHTHLVKRTSVTEGVVQYVGTNWGIWPRTRGA